MSTLKERLQEDMKLAMKSKEKAKLTTIRSILAAIKQKEIDEKIDPTDELVTQLLTKLAKQRKESIAQYQQANRDDLVEVEAFELSVIEQYLPKPLSEEEVAAVIEQAISEVGASSMKEMGRVMGVLQKSLQGKTDLSKVSQLVKEKLS
jgi:uncharacterized protein YqeY